MKISDEKKEIAKAYNILQKQMRAALKDATNPHYKSKYSTYESTWDALRDPLTDNGLSCAQDIITAERSVSIITYVLHVSGEWMEFGPLTMPVTKLDCQGFASAISYGKRYALQAAFGIVSGEDDDGNIACKKEEKSIEIKPVDQKIRQAQVQHIKNLLSSCPPGYEPWLLGVLEAKSIEDIDLCKYDYCCQIINKYLEEQRLKKAQQETKENE